MTQAENLSADDRLARAFAADLPPARDPSFSLAVMARAARRRLLSELLGAGALAAVAALVLWALWPVLARAIDPLAEDLWRTVAPAVAALAVVASLLALEGGGQRFGRTA